MAGLDLATRQSWRRKKCIAMLSLWLSTMHLLSWFWIIVVKHAVEHHVLSGNEEVRNQKKRKRSAVYDNQSLGREIKEAASLIASEIAKGSQLLSKAMGVDAEISRKRQKIDHEIRKIPNLTVAEVIKVVCHVARHSELIEVFFSMEEKNREELVRAILNGEV
ncbi:hypothetical protein C2S52_018532 [Perilla frutescens var. hirtella]|nr:hypothetical protein C2S52_018532 [Perilla frutescens var. hirtella]